MRLLTIALILSTLTAVCGEIEVAYINVMNNDLDFLDFPSESDPVFEIFQRLSDPPLGFTSCVPNGVLRIYFKIGSLLVLDLDGSKLADLNFGEERFALHQILLSVFRSLKDVENVKILVDGRERSVLVRYVDIRFSFPKELWSSWPQIW